MKEYRLTLSQSIGLFILILFAFVGWCSASYLWGHMRGADSAYKFFMANGSYIVKAGEGK